MAVTSQDFHTIGCVISVDPARKSLGYQGQSSRVNQDVLGSHDDLRCHRVYYNKHLRRQRKEHVEHEALLTLLASVNHVPNMRDTLAPREHTLLCLDGDGRNFSATLIGRICQILVIVVATREERGGREKKQEVRLFQQQS